jgi:hypothetical protein
MSSSEKIFGEANEKRTSLLRSLSTIFPLFQPYWKTLGLAAVLTFIGQVAHLSIALFIEILDKHNSLKASGG